MVHSELDHRRPEFNQNFLHFVPHSGHSQSW